MIEELQGNRDKPRKNWKSFRGSRRPFMKIEGMCF
jgi:hypothetical protein